jgi:hypothetical protein
VMISANGSLSAEMNWFPIPGLSTPVLDQAYYIDEIHYRIGERFYIENAIQPQSDSYSCDSGN